MWLTERGFSIALEHYRWRGEKLEILTNFAFYEQKEYAIVNP
jgi:hypothetical protein